MANSKGCIDNLNDVFKEAYRDVIDDLLGVPLHKRSNDSLGASAQRGNEKARLELQKRRTALYKFLEGAE